MKNSMDVFGSKVPQTRGIAGYTFADFIRAGSRCAVRPQTFPTFSNPQRQAIRRA